MNFSFGDDDGMLDAFDVEDFGPRPTTTGNDRYLTELADVLRAAGLDVVEVDGWQTRARSSGGYDSGRPWLVMWHHTASQTSAENDVNYICHGSPDRPLANLYLDRAGTVHVCAAGATNTNGKGQAFPTSKGTVPADSMNTYAVGVEMANSGVGEAWPVEQVDAMFALSLALTNWLGLEPTDVGLHHSYVPDRKIDPATADAVQGDWRPAGVNSSGSWSLDDVRSELVRRNTTQPDPAPSPPEGDDMPIGSFFFQSSGEGTMRHADGTEHDAYPGAVFYSDPTGVWFYWMTDEQSLRDKQFMVTGAGYDDSIQGPVDNCHAFGFLVGPVPSG